MRGPLAGPVGVVAAGVDVDEGGVNTEATAEEAFVAEFAGHVGGVAGGAGEDEVEGLVADVMRP